MKERNATEKKDIWMVEVGRESDRCLCWLGKKTKKTVNAIIKVLINYK